VRAAEALDHVDHAAASWRPVQAADLALDLDAHRAFADGVARRALYMIERGTAPTLPRQLAVTVVDDDVGGPYAVGPRDIFERSLREAGRISATGKGPAPRIVALYAEPRSWKGRASLGERTLAQLRAVALDAALVVLFGHPRLAIEIPGAAPVLVAWHGQPLMQRAAAKWLLGLS